MEATTKESGKIRVYKVTALDPVTTWYVEGEDDSPETPQERISPLDRAPTTQEVIAATYDALSCLDEDADENMMYFFTRSQVEVFDFTPEEWKRYTTDSSSNPEPVWAIACKVTELEVTVKQLMYWDKREPGDMNSLRIRPAYAISTT